MRRRISRYALTCSALLALAACGGQESSDNGLAGLTAAQRAADADQPAVASDGDDGTQTPPMNHDACAQLGEDACKVADGCAPLYGPSCPKIACDDAAGQECPACEDGDKFLACAADPEPGVACPSDPCGERKDEASCKADAACEPIYISSACNCAPCESDNEVCDACDCPPTTESFALCQTKDVCNGLDEATCKTSPECEAIYRSSCADVACNADDPANCPSCEPAEGYLGCVAPVSCMPAPGVSDGSSSGSTGGDGTGSDSNSGTTEPGTSDGASSTSGL